MKPVQAQHSRENVRMCLLVRRYWQCNVSMLGIAGLGLRHHREGDREGESIAAFANSARSPSSVNSLILDVRVHSCSQQDVTMPPPPPPPPPPPCNPPSYDCVLFIDTGDESVLVCYTIFACNSDPFLKLARDGAS